LIFFTPTSGDWDFDYSLIFPLGFINNPSEAFSELQYPAKPTKKFLKDLRTRGLLRPCGILSTCSCFLFTPTIINNTLHLGPVLIEPAELAYERQ